MAVSKRAGRGRSRTNDLGLVRGESGEPLGLYALQLFAPTPRVRQLVLTSKIHAFRWFVAHHQATVVHYYGVPPAQYRRLILGLRPDSVLLFGDLDPFDVATWLHLQRIFRGRVIVNYNWALDGHLVINDLSKSVLSRCATTMGSLEEKWWDQRRAREPELRAMFERLGPRKKLAIEALITLEDASILARHVERIEGK
jgi:hypothetical protein